MRYYKSFLILLVSTGAVGLEITLWTPGEQKCLWLGLTVAGVIALVLIEITEPVLGSGKV